jgi:hypothetical protein
MANAAWLALTVMAHNLGRAVGQLAGPTSNGRPPRRCAARSSPCPDDSSTPADDNTYDSRPGGPGPRRSPPRSTASTPSHCAAEHPPQPRRPGPRRSRQTGNSPTPTTRTRSDHRGPPGRRSARQDQRWIRAYSGGHQPRPPNAVLQTVTRRPAVVSTPPAATSATSPLALG